MCNAGGLSGQRFKRAGRCPPSRPAEVECGPCADASSCVCFQKDQDEINKHNKHKEGQVKASAHESEAVDSLLPCSRSGLGEPDRTELVSFCGTESLFSDLPAL